MPVVLTCYIQRIVGQILQSFAASTPDGKLYETVETCLPSGTYFVVLETENERMVQQILIQR